MSESDRRSVTTGIRWDETLRILHSFLDLAYTLPSTMTDKQLVDLMTACGNARQRLREKSGA